MTIKEPTERVLMSGFRRNYHHGTRDIVNLQTSLSRQSIAQILTTKLTTTKRTYTKHTKLTLI